MYAKTADLKRQMRAKIRKMRNLLSPSEQKSAAENLKTIISTLEFFLQAKTISGYLAFDGEIDLQSALELAISNHKQCYIPLLANKAHSTKNLFFAPYNNTSNLKINKLGIKEPCLEPNSNSKPIQPHNLDLILIPVVAFDRLGNRLGMGGGYFDATLKDFQLINNLQPKPKLIGIAHAFQEVEEVPTDAWDIPLDGIVTNKEFIKIYLSQ